jgi:hypothetical protein
MTILFAAVHESVTALFGRAAISELSLLSGVKRKLDIQPAKGGFWREAVVRLSGRPLRRKALKKIQDPPIPFSAAEIPRLRTSLAPIGPGPSRCTA